MNSRQGGGSARVTILLATFNGARFLDEQLQSIANQTIRDWILIISDDGSSDDTVGIIDRFRAKHPTRVRFIDLPPSGSPAANFFRLLKSCPSTPYVALSDQDDVWHPDKLKLLIEACSRTERLSDGPVLAFSDLLVTDVNLAPEPRTFFQAMMSRPDRAGFGNLLLENHVPGCAMLFNVDLLNVFNKYEGDLASVRMHDWWLMLLATAFGETAMVSQPLVAYRQHGRNTLGAVNRRSLRFLMAKLRTSGSLEAEATAQQARLFHLAYEDGLERVARTQLSIFVDEDMRKWSRLVAAIRLGVLKQGVVRAAVRLVRM